VSEQTVAPECIEQLIECVGDYPLVLPVGNRTKPPLSHHESAQWISLRQMNRILEYDPAEFTITANSGTRLDTLAATLAERGQYLPFDPMLVQAGATLGGTLAAGLSGAGKFRFGGIRDFILGIQWLTGSRELVTAGGKVVKNAAGFDLPKLMVGSLGRLGILTRLTLKVFPAPASRCTICVPCSDENQAAERISVVAASRWEIEAVDYLCAERNLYLRLAGPEQSNVLIADAICSLWNGHVVAPETAQAFWDAASELTWSKASTVVKVPTTLRSAVHLTDEHCRWSAAGNVVWVAVRDEQQTRSLEKTLRTHQLSGLAIRGSTNVCHLAGTPGPDVLLRVQQALDPVGRFPKFL
jgi:glycolate oxidase FAD binding subunit